MQDDKQREVEMNVCKETWQGTLAHYGISRGVSHWELTQIARAIRTYGAEMVDLALFGARFEKKTESFDPKDYLSLARILEKDREGRVRIDLYANVGDRKRKVQKEAASKPVEAEIERTDPDRVRQIVASAFKVLK